MHIERKPRRSDGSAARVPISAAPERSLSPFGMPLVAGLDFMLLLSELRGYRTVRDADPADLYGDFA